MKKEKGITLIALIITIIIMLILVAVTVNVAINGGLFGTANKAAKDTEREAIYDQIVSAMVLTDNGKMNVVETAKSAIADLKSKGYDVSPDINAEQVTLTVTGKKGTYKYTITEEEILKEGEGTSGGDTPTPPPTPIGDNADEDLIKDYFLGTEETGRSIFDVLDMEEGTGLDDEDSITDASTTVSMVTVAGGSSANDDVLFYVVYKGVKYRVTVDPSTNKTKSVTSLAYDTTGNIGKTATIDGEKYIVLYDAGEQGANVQLISANVLAPESVTLGYNDGQIDWNDDVISTANIFTDTVEGQSLLSDEEKAIYSYNHVIETLNAKCLSVVGTSNADILDVRSVGSNPTSKNSDPSSMYSSTLLGTFPGSDATYTAGSFQGKGKDTDTNYITDFDRMVAVGINVPENEREYWLASRVVTEDLGDVNFLVRTVLSEGAYFFNELWQVNSSRVYGFSNTHGVRPIVSLSSSALTKYLDS